MTLIDGIGLWMRQSTHPAPTRRQALFLDRDGVIVEDPGYLGRVEEVRMIPGSASAIARANDLGIPVIVATNQSGIARGLYGWEDFEAVQAAIEAELARSSARLDLVLACGFHDLGDGPLAVKSHHWRKPNPGMLLKAGEMLGLSLEGSVMVGDKVADLEAARRAGLTAGVLVRTGQGREAEPFLGSLPPPFEARVADSLSAALEDVLAYLITGKGL